MRHAWWLALLFGCEHGQSVAPDTCTHTTPGSECCLEDRTCTGEARFCVPPDVVLPACGPCDQTPGTCTQDFECQQTNAMQICEEIPCGCVGQKSCVDGCASSADCAEGQTCDMFGHRCTQSFCNTDGECPGDFSCSGSLCVRRGCSTNADCDALCVEGHCHQVAGECQAPSA
jgi:hypothetical protein